jgi:Flp pilus assembly protein TadB
MTASMALLAAGIPPGLELLFGSLAMGTAVGLVARELGVILAEPRKDLSVGNLLEHQRRTILRQRSRSYRFLEPLVDRLEPTGSRMWANRLPELQRELDMVETQTPWKASEYLVLKSLETLPVVLLAALFVFSLFGILPAVTIMGLALIALPVLNRRRVSDRARRYRIAVRNQLPFVVDLMALMLESGAIFRECLETAAEENRGEPVGEEFNRICRGIDQGLPQNEALRALARRMDDPDIFEIVFAINTAEERGTRLKETLSSLAEQMRHRRIQWLEKAAEEAKVHITWPGLLVMVACLLIVAAPMLLQGMGSMGR